jgi:hypothetical protein
MKEMMTNATATGHESGVGIRRFGRRRFGILAVAAVGVSALSLPVAGCGGIGMFSAASSTANGARFVGSGRSVTRKFDLADFEEIEVSSTFAVTVAPDSGYAVAVTADDNLIDQLQVERVGKTLRVGLVPGSYSRATLRAEIRLPKLSRIALAGASSATLNEFKSLDSLEVVALGASHLKGRVGAAALRATVAGASSVELGGAASTLSLDVSGASEGKLGDLAVKSAQATLGGASSGTVDARERLDATLSGASTLNYLGNPTLGSTSVSGASSLRRR